ncbi:hypothetical protein JL722_10686 [Aureococcus anophagefferens]|nr:hypothetical protein JL722_10686 [Aureococcus anophagefferens]
MEEFESLGFTDHMRDQILPKDGSPHRSQGRAVAGHAIAVRLARTYGVFNEQSPHFTAFVDRIRRGEIDMEEHGRKHSLKAGKTDASFFADKIGRNVMRRLRHDRGMLASYANLIIFVVHILVFMSVIALQRGVEGTERYQFFAIRDALLGFSNATTENGESYVRDFLLDFDTFEDFLRGDVLGMIFQDSECGDALCEPRDENPNYEPDPASARRVLDVASAVMAAALDDGWLDKSAMAWGARTDGGEVLVKPVAGWNVCHASDHYWGTPETVCLFDGDVQINGRPYRTAELDFESSFFGESKVLDLYAGDWELRYAFDGFAWTYPYSTVDDPFAGQTVQIGFPAIRGAVCTRDAFSGEEACDLWAPCPDANECACSYVDNVYRCFDDAYWAGFNAETMTHSTLKDDGVDIEMAAFPDSVAYEAIAKWWQIPRAPAATSAWGDRSAPAAVANASAWNPRVRKFSLVLLNVYASLTWLGNTVSILDAAGEVVTSETLTDTGCAVVDVLLSEGRTYAFESATTEAGDQYHAGMGWALYDGDALVLRGSGDVQACTFTVSDRGATCDAGGGDGASIADCPVVGPTCEGFATPDAVVSVFDYRCYGDGASSSGDANATAAPTPAAAAYALPPDDAVAAVDCAFDADLCNYEDGGGNGGPWTFFVGRTGTPNSGPKEFGDRSDADDGFAYVEASGTSNDTFILRSPAFAALAEPALLTFKLHAYGDRVAYMNLEGLVGGTWEVLFRTVYDQGHRWHEKSAEVPAATTRIRWRGFTYFWTGDIAIDDVAFAAAAAPTPAPTASEDDGRLRCYAGWKRYSEGDDFLAGQWQQDPSSEIVTCPADDTHCVLLEYAWPFAGGGVGWNGFNEPTKAVQPLTAGAVPAAYVGLGGCWSDFERMLLADMIHAGYDFPDPGPLDPRLCMNVKSEYYEQHALLSDCLACAGDLCNVPGAQDPAWYANVFNVSAQALGASGEYFLDELGVVNRISAQGMDTETGVFCSPQRMADGVCDLPQSGFACLHDGGDCLDDEHAYVAAPWVRYRKGEDGALDDWPYALVLGKPPQAHATVPHVLWRAVFDRVFLEGAAGNFTGEARVGNLAEPRGPPLAAVDPAKASESWDDVARYLPSAACPECAAYAGDFATVPFTVEVGPATSHPNRVIFGPLVSQRRVVLERCPAEGPFADLRDPGAPLCDFHRGEKALFRPEYLPNRASEAPFGVDPTFLESSFLYKGANDEALKDELYDNATELQGSGVPYGFFYDSGCPGARDFPVVFDTNLNRTRALELFDTLTEGAYFDKQTLDATVQMATVNVETGLLTYIEIVAERVKEGGIRVTDSYRVFDPRPYDSDSDVARAFLELANVAIVLALIFVECRELWHTYAVTGGIWDYVLSGSNFIDVLGYVVSLVMFAEWLHFWRLAARIRPLAHYDAYADIDAVGRITGASGDVDAIQDQYEDVKRASNSLARYDEYIAVAMIMMAFQLLKNLDFHPRIGMISRTVRAATTDLTYFIIVFLFVLEIYAFLGVLLHGKVHEDFENLFASSLTMMKALCGMFDDSAIEVTFINAAFYWSFMVLSFFLLLNSLLAIIVEAYTTPRSGAGVLLPSGLRRKSGRGREAAHEDLFLSVAELSDILECWFDAEDRPLASAGAPKKRARRASMGAPGGDDAPPPLGHKDREPGRSAPGMYARVNEIQGCPVSWRNFAWRWQKDNANDPIVCLDHHFLCCIFRILHARYEARMADEGAPPAEPPLCDEGVDVLVWNVLVRYGGKSADIDNSGHTTQHEMTALARLLRLQKTYDAHPDIDDGTALCAALNYFNGVSTQAEMEANFARELELDADLAELHHAGPDVPATARNLGLERARSLHGALLEAPDDAVPSSHELSYCGTL